MTTPLPDPSKPLAEQDLGVLLAMLVFGEAQNQSQETQVAVACCVRNRVHASGYGCGWSGVILHPNAFDCFNATDPNRKKLLSPHEFAAPGVWDNCYAAALAVFHSNVADVTEGATFYHDVSLKQPPSSVRLDTKAEIYRSRSWGTIERTVQFGRLIFYRPVSVTEVQVLA